jgi:hypothetical protein
VLVLPSAGASLGTAAAPWGVNAHVTSITTEKLRTSERLPAETLLVVSARVEDPMWADRLVVDEAATALLDGQGAKVARLLDYENPGDGPFASVPATREGPRVFELKLRFHAPPAAAPKPLWLDLQVRRYRNEVVTFEWREIGPQPALPLAAEKQGVSLSVDALGTVNEPAGPERPATEHLVLRVTATYLRATQTAPYATPQVPRLILDAEHVYAPTWITGTQESTPVYQGEVNSTRCQTTYRFGDLRTIPDFRDLVVEVRRPVELSQPLALTLEAPQGDRSTQ